MENVSILGAPRKTNLEVFYKDYNISENVKALEGKKSGTQMFTKLVWVSNEHPRELVPNHDHSHTQEPAFRTSQASATAATPVFH